MHVASLVDNEPFELGHRTDGSAPQKVGLSEVLVTGDQVMGTTDYRTSQELGVLRIARELDLGWNVNDGDEEAEHLFPLTKERLREAELGAPQHLNILCYNGRWGNPLDVGAVGDEENRPLRARGPGRLRTGQRS